MRGALFSDQTFQNVEQDNIVNVFLHFSNVAPWITSYSPKLQGGFVLDKRNVHCTSESSDSLALKGLRRIRNLSASIRPILPEQRIRVKRGVKIQRKINPASCCHGMNGFSRQRNDSFSTRIPAVYSVYFHMSITKCRSAQVKVEIPEAHGSRTGMDDFLFDSSEVSKSKLWWRSDWIIMTCGSLKDDYMPSGPFLPTINTPLAIKMCHDVPRL